MAHLTRRRALKAGLGGASAAGIAAAVRLTRLTQAQAATLTWATLRNATYPNRFVRGGRATLSNGSFARAGIRVTLLEQRIFGDLDADGDDDAVAIIATELGTSGRVVVDLIPVLNVNGSAQVQTYYSLGSRSILKSVELQGGVLRVVSAALPDSGQDDGDSLPDTERLFAFKRDRLILSAQSQLPPSAAEGPALRGLRDPQSPPQVSLDAELAGGQALRRGTLAGQEIQAFSFASASGRRLRVTLAATRADVLLSIFGQTDSRVLLSVADQRADYDGALDAAQPYTIQVVNLGNQPAEFTLSVALR